MQRIRTRRLWFAICKLKTVRARFARALSSSIEPNGKIAFEAPQDLRVQIDPIQLGDECIERIHVMVHLSEGSFALSRTLCG